VEEEKVAERQNGFSSVSMCFLFSLTGERMWGEEQVNRVVRTKAPAKGRRVLQKRGCTS
jgi:hypothetical protein